MEASAKAERDIEHASAAGSSALRAKEKVDRRPFYVSNQVSVAN